jgi:putative transposase
MATRWSDVGYKPVERWAREPWLKSDGAAKRDRLRSVEHRQPRDLNNHAENSHQPTRERARRMQGFTSPGQA